MLKTLVNALCCCQGSPSRSNPSNYRSPVGRMASGTYCVPGSTRRQKPFAEVRGPMTISDEDLIECWFSRLAAPEIVTKLRLQSTGQLRLHWRRLKELGKLPLSSREEFGRDINLERLIKVNREPRNDLFNKAK